MLILIAAAVIPAVFLLVQVYRLDRLEPEPPSLLLSLVILGVLSTALASLAEQLGDFLLAWFVPENTALYQVLLYFIVVGLSEEGFKYLLLRNRTWNAPQFNCQFDGVVYAVFVSMGFALWENIGYVLRFGMSTAVARAVTAIPGHACFGVFMGVWYGVAKRQAMAGEKDNSVRSRRLAVLVPTLLHGLYDYLAMQNSDRAGLAFLAFVSLLFIASWRLARVNARRDRYIDPPGTGPV